MPLATPRDRRPPVAALAFALLTACAAPDLTGLAVPEAEEPSAIWATPDSVAVGATATIHTIGCVPTSEVCAVPVRGLRWASADTLVATLAPGTVQPTGTVRVHGRRPGTTAVLVTSGSGRKYSLSLRVFP